MERVPMMSLERLCDNGGSWSWNAPTEPGWYWFVGVMWPKENCERSLSWNKEHKLDAYPVRVRRLGPIKMMYDILSSFVFPHGGECVGVWRRMKDVPTILQL